MRPLETLVVLGIVFHLLSGWVPGWRFTPWRRLLPVVLTVIAAGHLLVEGVRLMMAPAYLYVVIALMLWVRGRSSAGSPAAPTPWWRTLLRAVATLVVLALVTAPPILLPVMKLPAPHGPYAVGRAWLAFTDSTRHETFAADTSTFRALPVEVWYPAPAGTTGPLAPYSIPAEANIAGRLPMAYLDQFRYVKTHSIIEAPLATDPSRFWVLVFSHGYTGFAAQNTVQMEELASQGYVVFSITHPYEASAAPFPDGPTVLLKQAMLDTLGKINFDKSSVKKMEDLIAKIGGAKTGEERRTLFRAFLELSPLQLRSTSVAIWSADTRFVVDQLERLNGAGAGANRFAGHLDFEKLGIFGMSYGGATAIEFCRQDRRCKLGMNIDGGAYGGIVDDSLSIPFMIMASEAAAPIHGPELDRFQGPAYMVKLAGTTHIGLTDMSLYAPLLFRWMGLTGSLSGARREEIMTAYTLAFFDTYVKGHRSALLDGPSNEYPEVEYRSPRH